MYPDISACIRLAAKKLYTEQDHSLSCHAWPFHCKSVPRNAILLLQDDGLILTNAHVVLNKPRSSLQVRIPSIFFGLFSSLTRLNQPSISCLLKEADAYGVESVVQWLPEVAHDREALGSIPAILYLVLEDLPFRNVFGGSVLTQKIVTKNSISFVALVILAQGPNNLFQSRASRGTLIPNGVKYWLIPSLFGS